jgi:hypothetical protein
MAPGKAAHYFVMHPTEFATTPASVSLSGSTTRLAAVSILSVKDVSTY